MNPINARMKTIGYVRVSTDRQRDTGLSVEAQKSRLAAYASIFDLDLVAIVDDIGVSAVTLDREGLRRALTMLDAGKADALLVVKLDRLTRSVRDLAALVDRYFAKRHRLLSVSDMVDTHSAAGRLALNIITSVAQWEREATAERTKEAMAHKKARGEFTGGSAPYGFSVDNDGKLVSNDAEREMLRIVREFAASGLSMTAIANELTRAGVVPRSGKVWHAQQIKRMLAYGQCEADKSAAACVPATALEHLEAKGIRVGGEAISMCSEAGQRRVVADVEASVEAARKPSQSPQNPADNHD